MSNQGKTDPHNNGKEQYKRHVDGSIRVSGQIEVHLPPDYPKEETAKEKQNRSSYRLRNFVVSLLTLIAVIVYAGLTALQVHYTRQSLIDTGKQFRVDQRPLLKIELAAQIGFKAGTTQMGEIKVTNVGKTPARDTAVNVTVERVPYNQDPLLNESAPHISGKGGTLFPNVAFPDNIPYGMTAKTPDGRPEFTPMSAEDEKAFARGDYFYAIYAWANYTDFSGISHWTRFCTWTMIKPNPNHSFNAGKCTAYNTIDTN